VRVATKAFSPTQTRLLSRRCLVCTKLDGSRTATQSLPGRQARSTDFCRAFGLTGSCARHHPVRSPALPPNNRNPVRSSQAMLTSKFVSHKISISEMPPQNAFSVSCSFWQHASAVHERPLYLRTLNLKTRTKNPLTSILSPQAGRGGRLSRADASPILRTALQKIVMGDLKTEIWDLLLEAALLRKSSRGPRSRGLPAAAVPRN
jgi:hypothetical protein